MLLSEGFGSLGKVGSPSIVPLLRAVDIKYITLCHTHVVPHAVGTV